MTITLDEHSGFCAGVTGAIHRAEEQLSTLGELFCLGDIVHNGQEVERLEKLGLVTIDYDDLRTLHHVPVLLRAHGEPPSTYWIAQQNDINIIDGTCPVVRHLQERIAACYEAHRNDDAQIVIFGKKGHAEVIGLCGQTNDTAIVIEHDIDLQNNANKLNAHIDFTKPVYLFSQTTKDVSEFNALVKHIARQMAPGVTFQYYDTICRAVANRVQQITEFARAHNTILFVGGTKSSNGRVLFERCREVNRHTYFVSSPTDLQPQWVENNQSVGITGATSTPRWLMENVRERLMQITQTQLVNN